MVGLSGSRTAWRRGARHCWPMRWKAARDDPDASADADLGCLRGHGYEEGIRWPCRAGAATAFPRPNGWPDRLFAFSVGPAGPHSTGKVNGAMNRPNE